MSTDVKVPPFPESVEEGTLMTWHKQEHDPVARDEKIADIETDKIVLEVSAPADGVLAEIVVQAGETVSAGQSIARIEAGDGAAAPPKKKEKPAPKAKAEPTPAPKKAEPEPTTPEPVADKSEPAGETASPSAVLSPAVRRMVDEQQIDISRIQGTGRGGVITKADVLAYQERASAPPAEEEESAEPAARKPAETEQITALERKSAPASKPAGERSERRVAMTRIRARIAERLVQAQQEAALLTTFNEVNMHPIMSMRNRYKESFEKEYGVKLGFMGFFVKACVEALKKFPVINASIDGRDILYHGYYDIGIAVSTDRGLVVPILRDANVQSFAQIESAINDFAERARNSQLAIEELTGGTFTITNGGVFGSLFSTPIINPPQSAILGMHKIQDRPVAENGQVVIRPMMILALSYDHRIIDGREAVQFLVAVKESLEDPARLLLQV